MPGGIPLDSKQAAAVNDQALEKAATFLERTAQDLEQTATRLGDEIAREKPFSGGFAAGMVTQKRRDQLEAAGKARLLHGQAGHIRAMKLNIK